MARKTITHRITCPHCEGTKRGLNHFDPLENQRAAMLSEFVVDRVERAPSGREMYDWKCDECDEGIITITEIVK